MGSRFQHYRQRRDALQTTPLGGACGRQHYRRVPPLAAADGAGGTLQSPAGVLAIDRVAPVTLDEIAEEDARRAGYESTAALLEELSAPLTGELKNLGLTESLGVGYRISPRGRALLDSLSV